MRPSTLQVLLSAAAALVVACEGREVPVFELPVVVGGAAGTGGVAGTFTTAGSDTNSESGNGNAGAGTGGGESFAGSGPLTPLGGSAGFHDTGGSPGAGGGGSPAPCGSDQDCMPGWLCEKPGCDAATGNCVPWPPFCQPEPAPVCGCDGVTYWNDCIRLQAPSHTQLQSADQCRANACTCEVGADCMVPYASCSHLLPPGATCGHGMGACWVLPPQCPLNTDFKMWRECRPPDAGQPPACLDTCNAIATEHSYAELHRGDMCN
jgi:hypothetical protein